MTDRNLLVGPFNRVEGDLEVRLDVRDGAVAAAYTNSPLFRGFEMMMLGKDPRDALTITPRICGICSISQSAAAAFALADAAWAEMPDQGMLIAAILHAVENLADHLTHFNLFFMPDFARPVYADRTWHDQAVARFTAQQGSAARDAVTARAELLHIVGLLGGKWPHTLAIQPAGVTKAPTLSDKVRIQTALRSCRRYLETTLFGAPTEQFAALSARDSLMDWTAGDAGLFLRIAADTGLDDIGMGPGRFMSFGAYPLPGKRAFAAGMWDGGLHDVDTAQITEDISHAWMLGETAHPADGRTAPDEDMRDDAYSWCKAPRLNGQTIETGAFARQIIDGNPLARDLADRPSAMARVVGRLIEIARTQMLLEDLAAQIDPKDRFMGHWDMPKSGQGQGLVEAARGALGHWTKFDNGKITGYQIIAPTTWNFGPRDAAGNPGPLEAALVGAPVGDGEETPIAVQHIVRSFDPCMVCTVH
ncbi:HupV protein [Marivivens niveibacter]|uniref:HupV protein n=1 Tax=Marivivens niveibacter TaxID=1930667 RepID=A0A251X1I8_9RHOB|nr:nickel-dependent hydrogenase large subunit [Marivivens niveibacter]OUD10248.1 HupV protein [Marivivens niveibacter]